MAKSRMRIAIVALVVVGLAAACSGSDGDGASVGSSGGSKGGSEGGGGGGGRGARVTSAQFAGPALEESQDELAQGSSGGAVTGGAPVSPVPGVGPKVIKTASLELRVGEDDFQSAVQRGVSIAERNGGFVLSTMIDDQQEGRGSLLLRVPADRFGTALTQLEDLGKVKSETVTGEDVGQEFIDLEARLRNLTAQETVLLRLMNEANTIPDTIRVQRELEDIQLQVEQIRGRLRFLEDQTALGTIEVFIAEGDAAPPRVGKLQHAWEQAIDVFLSIVAALIVSIGVIVPIGLLVGIAVLVVMRVRPRLSS